MGKAEGEGTSDRVDVPDEPVECKIRFDWHYVDRVHVTQTGKGFVVREKKLGPGVYRLRALTERPVRR